MRTRPQPVFSTTPQNALQDSLARLTRWLPDRLPGRLSGSQIAEKHPSGVDRRACRANPLGHPAGARAGRTAGRTFCDPRTSCGDTNGSTLHVAKQVRGIQNPQSCRQAHRKSHLSGAPLLHLNRPDTLVFRLPTPSALLLVR